VVQIKRAYRKASLKWHPDKAKGDKKKAEERFGEIARAYEVQNAAFPALHGPSPAMETRSDQTRREPQ
jgi:hypothetical protein